MSQKLPGSSFKRKGETCGKRNGERVRLSDLKMMSDRTTAKKLYLLGGGGGGFMEFRGKRNDGS